MKDQKLDPVMENLSGSNLWKRFKRLLLGDPRSVPSRLVKLAIFGLFAILLVSAWAVLALRLDESGSSVWFVSTVISIVKHPAILVPILIVCYWRFVGLRRGRDAADASQVTGWLPKTIQQLADEVQSTDGTNRITVTTDHSYDEIRAGTDAALDGEHHPLEEVDFWGRDQDEHESTEMLALPPGADRTTAVDEAPDIVSEADALAARSRELRARHIDLMDRADALSDELDAGFEDLLSADIDPEKVWSLREDTVSAADLLSDEHQDLAADLEDTLTEYDAVLEEIEAVEAELDDVLAEMERVEDDLQDALDAEFDHEYVSVDNAADESDADQEADTTPPTTYCGRVGARLTDVATRLKNVAVRAALWPLALFLVALDRVLPDDPDEAGEHEADEDIPWKVRVAEELKHFVLDVTTALRSDDLYWKILLPGGIAFVTQLLIFRIWVSPALFVAIIASSTLVALLTFALSKKRRTRRLRTYRAPTEGDYWEDVAGRVKTVETADVTCYVGFTNGRRFASYDREEFVDEFSLRLYQYVQGEKVASSVMEQYARNLAQMKPNLDGHLEKIERPQIRNAIVDAVDSAQDQLIEKAHLAEIVIERHDARRFDRNLGHDPKLVGEEYRSFVEHEHTLSEVEVPIPDASGGETVITVVYPTEKTRLPEASRLHAQFSDRFTGLHGEPHYDLPDVDPTDDLRGFTPSRNVFEMLPSAKAALPEGPAAGGD